MNWHEYPILRLVVPLIFGILFYFRFPQWAPPIVINIVFLLILAFLAWPRKYLFPYKHRYISGIVQYLAFFFMGIALTQFQHNYHDKNYFGQYLPKAKFAMVTVIEPPEKKPKSIKLIVQVRKMGDDKGYRLTKGTAVVYLEKDSLARSLSYGDIIFLPNRFQKVKGPQNPDQFDYRKYLNNSGIVYQAYFKSGNWSKLNRRGGNILKATSIRIREFLLEELQKHNIKDAEFSITAAMLLGVRSNLSPELRQAFAGAGAMHILCVSGLHVGIIFMLLNHLLAFFDRLKKGRFWKTIIILLSIWGYAMITGLSPSVVRAASMFTFISIGQNINRQVNIYNSLAASAFVLLVINPYLILDLGFQLSYAAVIAIIALQKPLQVLWSPKWKVLFKIWQLITVSIAAQIGTAPLALYYFHSFPNYFLLTNLIVIPAAFVIFISGLAVLLFSWAGPLADYFGWLLSKLVLLLNAFISSLEHWPGAVSRNIYISQPQMIILILLSILISIMFITRKSKLAFVNLVLIIAFLVFDIYQKKLPDQFIVYQTGKYDYISFVHKNYELALTDADVLEYPDMVDFQTLEHRIKQHAHQRKLVDITKNVEDEIPYLFHYQNFVGFHGLRFAIIHPDIVSQEFEDSIEVDYLIISGNPTLDLEKLLRTYHCDKVIIASSNTTWNIKKWNEYLKSKGIDVFDVKRENAYVLDIK